MSTPFDDEKYISLETFKKDGNGVKTPVWVAPLDGKLYIFTEGSSFKVKRIRRNNACRVAACGMRGAIKGPWHDGTVVIVEDKTLVERAHAALRKKYGFMMAMGDFFAGMLGRTAKRAYLEVTITGKA